MTPVRRQVHFVRRLYRLALFALAGCAGLRAAAPQDAVRFDVARPEVRPVAAPAGKRAMAGWPVFPVGTTPVLLRFAADAAAAPGWLRVTTAFGDRESRMIEIIRPGDGRVVGRFDLRFPHAVETFEVGLTAEIVADAKAHGLALRLAADGPPVWLFGAAEDSGAAPPLPVGFQPHLMSASDEADGLAEFPRRIAALGSVQGFGWMEGCVLEGLRALAERAPEPALAAARDAHWRLFVPARDRLVYENPASEPADDRIYGIEGGLPFADLARRDPHSPVVDRFVAFARERVRADGSIQEEATLSAEGSYTIGYPLAVIAELRDDPELARLARQQLRLRGERLWQDGAIWLRRMDSNRRTFRGWSRGVAWHLLGVARSIERLRRFGDTAELEADLQRGAAWVLEHQRPDGLWPCFLEEPAVLPDAAGSAGIATALAIGARLGVLPPTTRAAARRTRDGLLPYLTPDGLLGGVSQGNRGGEALQRGDYRVLSYWGMGLFAQLLAECDEDENQAGRPASAGMAR